MRLIYIFAAILAVSVAETDKKVYEDLEAMETMELKKESADLTPAASMYNYIPPSQRPPQWNQNQPSYVPSQTWTPPQQDSIYPIHTQVPSAPVNPQYVPPVAHKPPYVPPVTASPPYVPPVTASPPYVPPVANPPYVPPVASPPYVHPVQSDYIPPQNDYYPPPHYHHPTTTTPVAVIKNEQYYGDNGSYKYEYQIADGTHVGEEGWFTDPKQSDESIVKKGWYSYQGADGKTYTVTYWADHTGFHAFGDHLPTPPPVPKEIQAALDAEKNKQPVTFPPVTQKPYYPTQQTYYPPQQTYYPQPGYGK